MYNSRKQGNEKDNVLIRCILSRCEVDLLDIKKKYKEMYGESLDSSIMHGKSGDWVNVLKVLIRKPRAMKSTITNPNEILDADFESRKKFFQKNVYRMHQSDGSLFQHNVKDDKGQTKERFFAGTVRTEESEPVKHSSLFSTIGLGSKSHFHLSLKHISENEVYDNSKAHHSASHLPLKVRSSVFRRTRVTSFDLKNERNAPNSSASENVKATSLRHQGIDSLRKKSTLCREVDLNVHYPK